MKKFVIYVSELSPSKDPEFEHSTIRIEHHGITQNELDYICSDLEHPKSKAVLFGSIYKSGISSMTL